MRRIALVLALSIAAAPAGAEPRKVDLTADQLASIKNRLASVAHDPSAVQFRHIGAMTRDGKVLFICGEMSAKNLLGIYGDYFPFVLKVDAKSGGWLSLETTDEPEKFRALRLVCASYGLRLE